ncbi:hypothetical protein GA0074692_1059 [Micromonospora pallida]|uniref:Uncharacterized protein n=1 Tax=Micromonospora pallida TaxID=145854 RepID=A0A1C6RUX2_9ACTN|nr:hypothetical protein [Micromonospora pallida]SCL21018.1 hypothetical protein GA0074692_1059 [Micromonospora pallida]
MTSVISRLWLAENLPIRDGLYRAAGTARDAWADPTAPGGLALGEPFGLTEFLVPDPEEVTTITVALERELSDGSGHLVCGEGSYGSEGFFGRLDRNRQLLWVVYLEDENPFVDAHVDGTRATFTSSSGVTAVRLRPDTGGAARTRRPGPRRGHCGRARAG